MRKDLSLRLKKLENRLITIEPPCIDIHFIDRAGCLVKILVMRDGQQEWRDPPEPGIVVVPNAPGRVGLVAHGGE